MNFAIKKLILSQADILILLNAFDAESTPSLSSHIDFVTWSKKLENAIFIQCYYNDEVIGTLAYYVNECVFITHIAVKSAYRRLHVAQKMLDSLLSTSCKDIKLEVRKDNRGAINFYKKNRFDIEEERENTYILKHELINKYDEKYTVCVHCPTYNHVNYIDDCLTGFVMQKTTFPFCVIVVDDASTDGNQSIIQKYADTYPEIIKPILLKENHYSKGIPKRKFYDEYDCQAKYVAMCEGDDYWTDPLKLQKQVDFMEENPEYVLCCHRYKIYNQNDGTWSDDYVKNMFELAPNGFSFTNKENLSHWATKTMTLLFRRAAMDKMPTRKIFRYWRDVHLNYYLLKEGPGYCSPFVGAVARRHSGGVFSSIGAMNQWRINLKVWNELVEHNREDDVLLSFYKSQHEGYRASVRNKIRDMRMYELLLDIRTLFYLDYHYGGVKEVIYSVKKILLSFWYVMKTKLNLK